MLLSPETLKRIPAALQGVLIQPLKQALAESLHVVFLVAVAFLIVGIIASLFMGTSRIQKKEPAERKERDRTDDREPAFSGGA